MKELKYTTDLENYIVTDLKSDEDIKLYLNASLKDYLEDGDFNSFYRALEIVIKAKDTRHYRHRRVIYKSGGLRYLHATAHYVGHTVKTRVAGDSDVGHAYALKQLARALVLNINMRIATQHITEHSSPRLEKYL